MAELPTDLLIYPKDLRKDLIIFHEELPKEFLIFRKDLPIFLCNSSGTSVSFFAGLQDLHNFQALVIWHPFMTQISHTNSDHNPFNYSD